MKAIKTPTAYAVSLDEIIFAQKNKAYGAYLLRKHYTRHMSFALLLSVSIFTIFSISSIVMNHSEPVDPTSVPETMPIPITLTDVNTDKPKEYVKSIEVPKTDFKATIRFVVPRVTVDGPDNTEAAVPDIKLLESATPSTITRTGNPGGVDIGIYEPFTPATDAVKRNIIKDNNIEQTVDFAEVMPDYPGGTSELISFLSSNISYPEIAKKVGVEGKVFVQFVVEKDGSLSHIELAKSIGAGCDEEAIRVCKLMSRWHPGLQNGKAVRVKMVIPILFKLQ